MQLLAHPTVTKNEQHLKQAFFLIRIANAKDHCQLSDPVFAQFAQPSSSRNRQSRVQARKIRRQRTGRNLSV
ncbi:hypothetical protein SynNOUM97013_02463 [Synechococcus sp. NOUM97013]|nr:hypothetical protein SynNOUM97013_02463 [Synechococcus sp. NOUM97013]